MSDKIEKIKQQSKSQSSQSTSWLLEKDKTTCPSCSTENERSASFCEACGTALKTPVNCHKCNAVTRPNGDICESCGTWLLKGQCIFCLADIDEDQTFCGECGNPTLGIPCPQCGKLSIFDFCKSCCLPLSIQAKDMVQVTTRDPLVQEMASLIEQLDSSPIPEIEATPIKTDLSSTKIKHDEQVLRLKEYRESLSNSATQHKPKSAPKALFSNAQKERIGRLNKEVAEEEKRRRVEEERKRREAEERRLQEEERQRKLKQQLTNAMHDLSGKTFSSNQEARRFFMNIIAGLPEDVAREITAKGMGWRCNAYDCVHDSPSECAAPSQGGVWLFY